MKKLDYETVKNGFEIKQWQLISKAYEGSQKKLNVICPAGHETEITWNNFQREQGCKYCAGNVKFDYLYIKKYFENAKCQLLATEYVNNLTPMDYICECGNKSKIRFADFAYGARCQECKKVTLAEKNRDSDDKIKLFCEENKCELLSTFVKNHKTCLNYKCKCGRISKAYFTNFQRFPNCMTCGADKKRGDKCHLWNPDRQKIALNRKFRKMCGRILRRGLKTTEAKKTDHTYHMLGYTGEQLQNHIMNHPNYKFLVQNKESIDIDHIIPIKAFIDHSITDMKIINALDNLQPMSRLDNEIKADKYDETEFYLYLKNHGVNLLNVAHENENNFQQWLSTIDLKDSVFELINPQLYSQRGVMISASNNYKNQNKRSFFILPSEWHEKNIQCKNRILSLIGQHEHKIFARKCIVKEISKQQCRQFCRNYHVQGSNKLCVVAFGLYEQENLIGIMSLGKHPRQYNTTLLDRMCFKQGYHIIGGASKLFSKCREWCGVNNIKEIVSFSDNRWSSGGVYSSLGFNLDKELPQDYFYVEATNSLKYHSKQSQKKKNTSCPKDITEIEWATMNGLIRVWDCGKKRWICSI